MKLSEVYQQLIDEIGSGDALAEAFGDVPAIFTAPPTVHIPLPSMEELQKPSKRMLKQDIEHQIAQLNIQAETHLKAHYALRAQILDLKLKSMKL